MSVAEPEAEIVYSPVLALNVTVMLSPPVMVNGSETSALRSTLTGAAGLSSASLTYGKVITLVVGLKVGSPD